MEEKYINNYKEDYSPKKSYPSDDSIKEFVKALDGWIGQTSTSKSPEPKAKRKPENLSNITIKPVANGYIVTSTETGDRMFVFPDMESLKSFIENALAPTGEQKDFIDAV